MKRLAYVDLRSVGRNWVGCIARGAVGLAVVMFVWVGSAAAQTGYSSTRLRGLDYRLGYRPSGGMTTYSSRGSTSAVTVAPPGYFMSGLASSEQPLPVLPWTPQPVISPYLYISQTALGGLGALNYFTLTRPAVQMQSNARRLTVQYSLLEQRNRNLRVLRESYDPLAPKRSASFMNRSHYFKPR